MRRPKKDKGLVTPTGWTITEAERTTVREEHERRARRNRSCLWALRLLVALLVLASAVPYLRNEELNVSLSKLFDLRPAAPVNPGDHNGLLRK